MRAEHSNKNRFLLKTTNSVDKCRARDVVVRTQLEWDRRVGCRLLIIATDIVVGPALRLKAVGLLRSGNLPCGLWS